MGQKKAEKDVRKAPQQLKSERNGKKRRMGKKKIKDPPQGYKPSR